MKKEKLKIVADAHIWGVESAFFSIPNFDVELSVLESREITREQLKDTDILLTRSSTKVNAALLEGTPVRFAGTATIGDDHYDKAWLEANNIAWANAAGSSTGSVIEYMISALLELHMRKLVSIPHMTLGIIGAGRIGSALAKVCTGMGMNVLLNDPPRERVEGDDIFSSIDSVLEAADVITLHTPLTHDGEDKTFHLINAALLSRFQGKGVINVARGACVDNHALADWLGDDNEPDADQQHFAVLDCWEGEPAVSTRLLTHANVVIATPHIAGHSLDGKAANTQYIYHALCEYLGVKPVWNKQQALPKVDDVHQVTCSSEIWHDLYAMVMKLYPIMRDDAAMRSWGAFSEPEMAKAFADFRRHYPVRRSWQLAGMKVSKHETLSPTVYRMIQAMAHRMGIHVLGSGL